MCAGLTFNVGLQPLALKVLYTLVHLPEQGAI